MMWLIRFSADTKNQHIMNISLDFHYKRAESIINHCYTVLISQWFRCSRYELHLLWDGLNSSVLLLLS